MLPGGFTLAIDFLPTTFSRQSSSPLLSSFEALFIYSAKKCSEGVFTIYNIYNDMIWENGQHWIFIGSTLIHSFSVFSMTSQLIVVRCQISYYRIDRFEKNHETIFKSTQTWKILSIYCLLGERDDHSLSLIERSRVVSWIQNKLRQFVKSSFHEMELCMLALLQYILG